MYHNYVYLFTMFTHYGHVSIIKFIVMNNFNINVLFIVLFIFAKTTAKIKEITIHCM